MPFFKLNIHTDTNVCILIGALVILSASRIFCLVFSEYAMNWKGRTCQARKENNHSVLNKKFNYLLLVKKKEKRMIYYSSCISRFVYKLTPENVGVPGIYAHISRPPIFGVLNSAYNILYI